MRDAKATRIPLPMIILDGKGIIRDRIEPTLS
jgi:hypothetical protein